MPRCHLCQPASPGAMLHLKEARKTDTRRHAIKIIVLIAKFPRIMEIPSDFRPGVKQASTFGRSYTIGRIRTSGRTWDSSGYSMPQTHRSPDNSYAHRTSPTGLAGFTSVTSLDLLGLGGIPRRRALGGERRPESRREQSRARGTVLPSVVLDPRIGAIGE